MTRFWNATRALSRLREISVLAAVVMAFGCAGAPFSAPIEGLPVCADFETGHAKMEGGLRFPVRVRVLDGKAVLFHTVITGLRHEGDPTPRTFIVDDNANYTIEWAQCANPRAPRSLAEIAKKTAKAREHERDPENAYECGEAVVYKTGVLQTKKHDKASHVIQFVPPPNPACWTGDSAPTPAPAPPASAAPTASAAPAASEEPDASAAPTASAAASAPAAPATNAGDAGAKH